MNQGNAAAIPTTVSAWNSAPHVDRYPEDSAPVDPILALVTELCETNRLLAALLARDSVTSPSARQDPRTYQTIDKPAR